MTDFLNAIREAGYEPPDYIEPGRFYRFPARDKPRGNKAGYCYLFADGGGGYYGDWITHEKHYWFQKSLSTLSAEDRERYRREAREAAHKEKIRRQKAQQEAAHYAKKMWSDARPAIVDHPYLVRKKIPALCLRQLGNRLLVPMRDVAGELVNLQRIYSDGGKAFLADGQVTGAFALFARELPREGELYIAEGWATAATIATTLRLPVVAAMNTGNLSPVALAIRAARPGLVLTIAADDDHRTSGNPGMTKAAEAARLVQAGMTWPTTCRREGCDCTDFNDVASCARASR